MFRTHREGSKKLLTLSVFPLVQPHRMAVAQVRCQGLSWPGPCGYIHPEFSFLKTFVSKTHEQCPLPQKFIGHVDISL